MILDTNAVSGILAGDPAIEPLLRSADRHHLPIIVIGEYRFGLRGSRRRTTLEPLFERLIRESLVLELDERTAECYAAIRDELKSAGCPIPENDLWIAALARQHALEILTRDQHFDDVLGVRRLGW